MRMIIMMMGLWEDLWLKTWKEQPANSYLDRILGSTRGSEEQQAYTKKG